jgi:hypothetical protein
MAPTMQDQRDQFHLARLTDGLSPLNPHVQEFLGKGRDVFMQRTGDSVLSKQLSLQSLDELRQQQAVSRLFRRLLAVRRPDAGTCRPCAADETLGGREG